MNNFSHRNQFCPSHDLRPQHLQHFGDCSWLGSTDHTSSSKAPAPGPAPSPATAPTPDPAPAPAPAPSSAPASASGPNPAPAASNSCLPKDTMCVACLVLKSIYTYGTNCSNATILMKLPLSKKFRYCFL